MSPSNGADPQDTLDEAPWSEELIDAIQQAKRVCLVERPRDATLVMDPGGYLALDVPPGAESRLTLDVLGPVTKIAVIRPGTDAGCVREQAIKHRLERIGWRGKLIGALLFEATDSVEGLWELAQATAATQAREQAEGRRGGPPDDPEQLFKAWLAVTLEHEQNPVTPIKPARQAVKAKGPRPIIVHADAVDAQPIEWLWKPYIPRAMPVILDGDPGLGKGLMIIQVATNLSKGLPFLDQLGKPTLLADVHGPQTTLILSAEESIEHIMIPRLDRAGADKRYIKFMTGWLGPEDEERAFTLQREHLPALIQAIKEWQPALVILDPLVAYLGDIDMHRSNETRPVMAALKTIAERYACTILGVRHPGKTDLGGRLMYRGQGNADIIGAARSGLWVQPHPVYPDTQTILLQSKSNVGQLGRTVIFTREGGNFAWKGVSRLTESMLTGKGPDPFAMLEAFFWLEGYMRPGIAYKASEVEKAAAEKEIGKKPLERAKKLLRISSTQVTGGWTWTLPPLSS